MENHDMSGKFNKTSFIFCIANSISKLTNSEALTVERI